MNQPLLPLKWRDGRDSNIRPQSRYLSPIQKVSCRLVARQLLSPNIKVGADYVRHSPRPSNAQAS